jgi:hypothetical protein
MGGYFKVASFDAFNDIGPAIHSISCAVFRKHKKYPRESNFLILAFMMLAKLLVITDLLCTPFCVYNFSIFKIEQCRNTSAL